MTCEGSRNATSSLAPGSGQLQLDLLAGPTTSRSGPVPARANRSRKQESVPEQMTQGIYGPTFFGSSVPAGPMQLWESRLLDRLAAVGSPEYALIWNLADMPSGPSISRLARSVRLTKEIATTGSPWRSPPAGQNRGGAYSDPEKAIARMASGHTVNLEDQIVASWPTVCARDGMPPHKPEYIAAKKAQGHGMANLNDYLALSPWVTPSARDWKDTPGMTTERPDGRSRIDQLPRQMAAQWSTQRASDGEKGAPNQSFSGGGQPLPGQLYQASMWPTPTSLSFNESHQPGNSRNMNKTLELAAGTPLTTTGPMPDGSDATTEKRGVPNPVFACWLMGFPDELIRGVLRATLSYRLWRRKSSKRTSKRKA